MAADRDGQHAPRWPSAVGVEKPGSSAMGMTAAGSPRASVAGLQPEPRTTATSCGDACPCGDRRGCVLGVWVLGVRLHGCHTARMPTATASSLIALERR